MVPTPTIDLATIWSAAFLVIGVSTFSGMMFALPKSRPVLLFLMVFTFPLRHPPFAQSMFFTWYRGMDRGYTVALSDTIFLAFMFFILSGGMKVKKNWIPKGTLLWTGFIIVNMISASVAEGPFLFCSYSIYKLFRLLALFWVISNLCKDHRNIRIIIIAFLASAVHQGIAVFWWKYVTGEVVSRVSGTFVHSNAMGMYLNAILPVFLILILNNSFEKKWLNYLAMAGLLLGYLCVLFSKSRGSIVIGTASLSVLALLVVVLRPTGRKLGLLLIGTVCLGIVAALALPRIIQRFETAPKASAQTREYFNSAAKHIAKDKTFGCGVNLFPYTIATTDYYWDVYPDFADLEDRDERRNSPRGLSRLGIVHHVYFLVAAETGWIGLTFYVLFLCRIFLIGANIVLWDKNGPLKSIAFGLLFGILTLYLQSFLEFVLLTATGAAQFMTLAGILVGIDTQRKSGRFGAR